MSGWKRWLVIGLGVVLGGPMLVCAGTGIAGLFVDGEMSFEVTETLPARPEAVFGYLDDAEGIASWWGAAMADYVAAHGSGAGMDVVHVPGTPEMGPGCKVDFVAGGMTAETWQILAVQPGRSVTYDIDFKLMHVERTLTLAPEGDGTRMTWAEHGTIGNPWMRLMASAGGSPEGNFRGAMKALGKVAAP